MGNKTKMHKSLIRSLFALCVVTPLASGSALAQSSGASWLSGSVLTATQLQNLDNSKVNVTGGASTNQALTTPSITGGISVLGGTKSDTLNVTGAATVKSLTGDISAAALSADMTGAQAVTAINSKLAVGADSSSQLVTAANSVATGTFARTLAERAMSMPQPGDFLSASQAVSDLTTGGIDIGALVNTAESLGVRSIQFPCGTYKQTTTINLVNNFSLFGSGACTIISLQMTSGNGIYGTATEYNIIQNLTYQADVTRTADAAIELSHTFEETLKNIFFLNGSGKHWNDIVLIGANGTHMDHMVGRGGAYDGLLVTGDSSRSEDTYLTASGFDGYGNAPIELQWSSGFYADKLDLLGGVVAGVLIDPGSPAEVDGTRGTAILADSNIGPGWLLSGNGAITEFNITNCWGSTNGYTPGTLTAVGPAQGFAITNSNANDITVASSEFHNNSGAGIDIQEGQHIVVNGNTVFMNSGGSHGTYPGINVGANPNFIMVNNNMTGAGGEAQGSLTASYQSYGIFSAQETSDTAHYALFSGNMSTGNQTGNFKIPTSTAAVNVVSVNNMGF